MSIIKRDTEQCVYIRFQVNEARLESFQKMFLQATKNNLLNGLRGVSRDHGNMNFIISFQSLGNTEQSKRTFIKTLNNIFVKLFDFYPSISEKPSDLQAAAALTFIKENSVSRVATSLESESKIPVFN